MKYLRHLSLVMVLLFSLNACGPTELSEGGVCTNVANTPLCAIGLLCDGITARPADTGVCRQICDPFNGNGDCKSGDSCVASAVQFQGRNISVCRPN